MDKPMNLFMSLAQLRILYGQDLILVFSVPTPPGGKVDSLIGNYEIKLAGG